MLHFCKIDVAIAAIDMDELDGDGVADVEMVEIFGDFALDRGIEEAHPGAFGSRTGNDAAEKMA